jgi:hypothetical protein
LDLAFGIQVDIAQDSIAEDGITIHLDFFEIRDRAVIVSGLVARSEGESLQSGVISKMALDERSGEQGSLQ